MSLYGERENAVRPALQIAMSRSPRLYAPGGTMHVVARCNNGEFYFTAADKAKKTVDKKKQKSKGIKQQAGSGLLELLRVLCGIINPYEGKGAVTNVGDT